MIKIKQLLKTSKSTLLGYKKKLKNCKRKAVLKAIKFLNYNWIFLIQKFLQIPNIRPWF